MSAPSGSNAVAQTTSFEFTPDNLALANRIIAKYPEGKQQSAVMPLLDLAQRQNDNWLPIAAMEYIAKMLGMAPIRVREVATFYTMYNHAPLGKHHVQICTTTPCWLRGSEDIVHACEKKLGIKVGETTADGQFTLAEVECLGACVTAPLLQVGDHYYEDLTPETTVALLEAFARGEKPKPGNQSKRLTSSPEGGFTTLTDTVRGSAD
jgi:NADH dehydrogenase (ubiquinone) flavoprotein 2